MDNVADWQRGLDDRDAERRRDRNERWMTERGFPPLGEEESESVPDRAERLAARHTRYDGSPR